MPYTVIYSDYVSDDVIPAIPRRNKEQISKAINERLTADPIGLGKPLKYELKGYRRLRVGDWRVVYMVEGKNVIIYDIVLRRDAYN